MLIRVVCFIMGEDTQIDGLVGGTHETIHFITSQATLLSTAIAIASEETLRRLLGRIHVTDIIIREHACTMANYNGLSSRHIRVSIRQPLTTHT